MDKKQRIEIAVTAVLVLILILVWANTAGFMKKRARPQVKLPVASSPAPVSSATPIPPQELAPKKIAQGSVQEKLEWVRDPFSGKPYAGRDSGPATFKLDGIIWDEKKPLALINGRILKVGDRILTNRIIQIKPDRVILNDGLSDFELKLQ